MWKLRRIKKGQRGFTLIELMIVTSIVGILAAVVATGVTGTTVDGRIAAKAQDVDLVQQAVDSFYQSETETYPYVGNTPSETLDTPETALAGNMVEEINFSDLVPKYLRELPKYGNVDPAAIGSLTSAVTLDLDGDETTDWTIPLGTTIDLTNSWVMDKNGKVYCIVAAKVY